MKRKAYIVHNLDSLATLLLLKWNGVEFDSIDCVSYKNSIQKLEEKFVLGGDNKKFDEFYFINFYGDVLDEFQYILKDYKCKSLVSDQENVLTHTLIYELIKDKIKLTNEQRQLLELVNDLELNYFEDNKSLLVQDMFNTLEFAYSKFLDYYNGGYKPHQFFKESINKFKASFDKNKIYEIAFDKYNLVSIVSNYNNIYFYCYKYLSDDKYDGVLLVDVDKKRVYCKIKNFSDLNGLKLMEKLCNGIGTRRNSSGDLTNALLQFIRKYEK